MGRKCTLEKRKSGGRDPEHLLKILKQIYPEDTAKELWEKLLQPQQEEK